VLAIHDPPDTRPPARWLAQLESKPLSDRPWPKSDIRNISGASLTARGVTESVRLSLALYEIVIAPKLAAEKRR
jgi:Na+-transporting NADH:ubiquinone oxidoreductase subunit NqrC